MQEKVVVHYRTGALLKGFATNFNPDGGAFTMTPLPADTSPPVTVDLSQLKAVFFVRDFTGDANYDEVKAFEPSDRRTGRRIEAVMYDGETLVGSADSYEAERDGFFLVPADPRANNIRCFVVAAAVKRLSVR
jgi:hypothetical protein